MTSKGFYVGKLQEFLEAAIVLHQFPSPHSTMSVFYKKLFPPWYFFFHLDASLPHSQDIGDLPELPLFATWAKSSSLPPPVVKFLGCYPLWILPHVPVTPQSPSGTTEFLLQSSQHTLGNSTGLRSPAGTGASSRIHHFPCWLASEVEGVSISTREAKRRKTWNLMPGLPSTSDTNTQLPSK